MGSSEDKLGKGAVKSPLDERDYQWEEVAMGIAPFDWSKGYDIEKVLGHTLSPKDQGSSSSCGGQAWSMLAAVQEDIATQSFEERSAKYVYAQTFVPGGGSGGRANSEIYKGQGISYEKLCPSYEPSGSLPSEMFITRVQDITAEARKNAKEALAATYFNVSPDIDSIAQAIKTNGGVVLGIDGSNNGTWLSEFPKMPQDGEKIWRHWVYAGKAKIVRGVKYIGVLNSWGAEAGVKGWQWLSEEYINGSVYDSSLGFEQACIWEVWTATINKNGPISSFKHNFATNIKFGQHGEEVRALQLALQNDGSFPAGFSLSNKDYPTANYAGMTAQAVLKFRLKHGISSATDTLGHSVGPLTRAKLNEFYNK